MEKIQSPLVTASRSLRVRLQERQLAGAPYGQAAAIQNEKIYDKVKDKFVLGENISQTASVVVSGSAGKGIVALSLALSPNMKDRGRYVEVPPNDYPPIEQACVVLSTSKDKDTARQFLAFVKTAVVSEMFKRYGFDVDASLAK